MKLARLLILLGLLVTGKCLCRAQEVPFRLHQGYLIVARCSVGASADLAAVIDTGSTESVLDLTLVQRLSLTSQPDRATFLTQEVPVSAVTIPGIQLGSLHTGPLDAIATDLSSLTHQLGFRIDILIGMDVLRQTSFVIDYKAKRLVFTPKPLLAHKARLAHDLRLALVEAVVGGRRALLELDTGFSGLLLYAREGYRLAQVLEGKRVQSLAKTLVAADLRSSEVEIGTWRAAHAEVTVTPGPRIPPGFDGLLGVQVLHATRIAFGFEEGWLSWE